MFFFSKIFAIYFAIKVTIKLWNFFTIEKVVNPTFPKNNLFHQVYSMTTFEVVFSHPLGLTEQIELLLTATFIASMAPSKLNTTVAVDRK